MRWSGSIAVAFSWLLTVGGESIASAAPPKPTRIVVTTSHPAAMVVVDGRKYGPAPADVDVQPGGHMIEVLAVEHLPWRTDAFLERGQSRRFHATLEPLPRPKGHHEHDGFMFRLFVGMSHMRAKAPSAIGSGHRAAAALSESIALGITVARDLILQAQFDFDAMSWQPQGENILGFFGWALGGSYYLRDYNIYVSPHVMPRTVIVYTEDVAVRSAGFPTTEQRDYEANSAVAVGVTVGKEFWVSKNWALGAAVRIRRSGLFGGDAATTSLSLGLSFTYN